MTAETLYYIHNPNAKDLDFVTFAHNYDSQLWRWDYGYSLEQNERIVRTKIEDFKTHILKHSKVIKNFRLKQRYYEKFK